MRWNSSVLGVVAILAAAVGGSAVAGPGIVIEPYPVVVYPGESVRLEARIYGPSEYRVKWILQGPLMEASDAGTLTEDGTYTAPSRMPMGPIRIVAQVSTGPWNLPVAAASVPVDVIPEGFPKPDFPKPDFSPPQPPTPPAGGFPPAFPEPPLPMR